MTLGDFADFAQIISGIAVLVTLIFLVVQLRDNTKALRMNALNEHYSDGFEIVADGSRVPELAVAAQKAFTSQPLDAADKYHLNNWIARTGGLMERHLLAMQEGLLDQKTFDRSVLPGKNVLRTPAGRASYATLKRGDLFGPEIREYIDNFYAELDQQAAQEVAKKTSAETH